MSDQATDIILETTQVLNTVANTVIETVAVTTAEGYVITVANDSTILVETSVPTVVVTGIMGPPGPAGTSEEDMSYSKRVDFVSDSIIYRGEAVVGSSESSPVWRIRYITLGVDGDVSETWASGNANFDKVWADRALLSYS